MKTWVPRLPRDRGPTYVALAEALSDAVQSGHLAAGTRLPPQRTLAKDLGIDLTTVSRAMALAQTRGLVVARGRAGSFVARSKQQSIPALTMVDLSVNYPPPLSEDLQKAMRGTFREVVQNADASELLDYPRSSWVDHTAQAARWCGMLRLPVEESRIAVAGGAQQALLAITSVLCERGDTIVASGLTYPGMMTIARRLGVRVVGVDFDAHGIIPEALEEALRRLQARYVYVVPTFDNPTTATADIRRRAKLAAVIDKAGAYLVEDDGHAALLEKPIAPLSSLIPERSYYVSSLSKSVSPGLRTAYVVTPSAQAATKLSTTLIALGQFPAPVVVSVSSKLIESGTATEMTAGMRQSASERWEIAHRVLPELQAGVTDTNHFGWLPLPRAWRAENFADRTRSMGTAVTAASAFAVSTRFAVGAVRVCLGAPASLEVLESALTVIASILRDDSVVSPPPY